MKNSDKPKLGSLLPSPPEEENHYFGKPPPGRRRQLFHIIFESDTRAGRIFDLTLLTLILTSVAVVMFDSVRGLDSEQRGVLVGLEWFFTAVFTLEYIARLVTVQRPLRYALSFFGIVDLIAILPTYLAYFFPELHALIDIRVLRMLRVFRILKLTAYITEYRYIGAALYASRRKIFVFLSFVLLIQVMLGTVMYVIEGPENGFSSIPVSIYWGITTMTTVGFGDIVPKTDMGRVIASVMMLLGWGILAVPTGIVTAEMTGRRIREDLRARNCPKCGTGGHADDARFCQDCGASFPLK